MVAGYDHPVSPIDPESPERLEQAIAALTEPGRLDRAQELVAGNAPELQRILATALEQGGWFDDAQTQAVAEAIAAEDPSERERAVRTLLAEETRVGMFVGVAVGFQLAVELESPDVEPKVTEGS